MTTATRGELSDQELVAAVRSGDEAAFEELYRRYHAPIAAYARRMVRDEARAEDLAQDTFFSALRHLRATDAEIDFKPWIYGIARNATIDHWRRASRAEEVSVDNDERLRPSDRVRLVGSAAADSALVDKERLTHLQGAFDELGDVQARALVMRELEGMSYREIAEELDVSRSSVETTLIQARQRLEVEYTSISEGRRCESVRAAIGRLAEGPATSRDEGRLARHARRCPTCLRHARELGVEPVPFTTRLRRKVAGLLPFPFLEPAAERAAAIAAAVVIAGAGGAAIGGVDLIPGGGGADGESETKPAGIERPGDPASKPGAGAGSPESSAKRDARRRNGSEERSSRGRRGSGADDARDGAGGGTSQAGSGTPNQGGSPGEGGRAGGGPLGTDLPGTPNLPGTLNLPNTPNLPNAPNLPDAPNLPATPNLPAPDLPSTPNLPQAPNVPSVPPAPQLPSAPSVQTPSLPQTPPIQTPTLPSVP